MILKYIRGNFKRGVEIELAERTLVVAPPRAGKTSVVHAARLLLEGKLDGAKAPGDYLLYATHGYPKEELRLVGAIADPAAPENRPTATHFVVEGTTAKASRPKWSGKTGVVVSDLVDELLAESPKNLREKLLAACAPEHALGVVEAMLPENFKQRWTTAVSQARALEDMKDAPEADLLVAAADLLRKEVRIARKASKEGADGENRPEEVTEAALDVAQARVQHAQEVISVITRAAATADRIAALRPDLAEARKRAEAAGGPLPSKAEIDAARARLKGAVALLARYRTHGGVCLACGHHVNANGLNEAAALQAAAETKLKDVEARSKSAGVGRSVAELEAELAELLAQKAGDEEWLRTHGTPQGVAAEEALTEARNKHGELLQKAAIYRAWNDARANAMQARAKVDELSAMVKTIDRAVKEVLFDAVDTFVARANAALPHGYRLDVQLYDGSRSICRISVQEPGDSAPIEWRALSGVQKATATAAIADAWAGEVEGDVKLIVVDDVWLDKASLVALCQAVGAVVGKAGGATQAIVCAVEYDGPPIPNWKIVRLGGGNF